MEPNIRGMSCAEIISRFLEERGLDVHDETLRKKYSLEMVERARVGDKMAIIQLLKIGVRFSGPVSNMLEEEVKPNG